MVLDNQVFSESIESLANKGAFKKCKIITGFTKNEFGDLIAAFGLLGPDPKFYDAAIDSFDVTKFNQLMALAYRFYPAYPELNNQNVTNRILDTYLPVNRQSIKSYYKYFERFSSDLVFICPSFRQAEIYSQQNKVYFYEYASRISSTIYPPIMEVVHTDDVPTLFAETLGRKVGL